MFVKFSEYRDTFVLKNPQNFFKIPLKFLKIEPCFKKFDCVQCVGPKV